MAKATATVAAPTFEVDELVANSYTAFGIPRHIAVGAMTLAKAKDSDMMTVDSFKAAVDTFLKRPLI